MYKIDIRTFTVEDTAALWVSEQTNKQTSKRAQHQTTRNQIQKNDKWKDNSALLASVWVWLRFSGCVSRTLLRHTHTTRTQEVNTVLVWKQAPPLFWPLPPKNKLLQVIQTDPAKKWGHTYNTHTQQGAVSDGKNRLKQQISFHNLTHTHTHIIYTQRLLKIWKSF